MPQFCAVVGCGNKSGTSKTKNLSFFRIPSEKDTSGKITTLCKERRTKWIQALRRADLTEIKLKYARICSQHFISGKPANLWDQTNPDWIPSVQMGYNYNKSSEEKRIDKYNRAKKRRMCSDIETKTESDEIQETEEGIENPNDTENETDSEPVNLEKSLREAHGKIVELETRLQSLSFNLQSFNQQNDMYTKFYTGLPNFQILKILHDFVSPYLSTAKKAILTTDQQLILTLMKLRQNFLFTDLGFRFNIDRRTASRTFYFCLNILYYRLKWLIYWPNRDELISTTPSCFKEVFGNKVTAIIDCFEVFIEKSANPDASSSMFSRYKHHQTVKFLIAVSPQGTIMFISEAYGGKSSDKTITETSGFLDKLSPGDLVLADRGFLIKELVNNRLADVKTPAFLKQKTQMHPKDLEQSRKLSRVRVHVERVIGQLQNKYTIFNKLIQMDMVKSVYEDGIPAIDKMVVVACALVNLCPSVVM